MARSGGPSEDDPTGYMAEAGAPTELAGVADADTQSAFAWGLEDDEAVEPEPPRWSSGRITAIAVAAAVVVIVAASGVAVWALRDDPAPAAAPRADLLDGVYHVRYQPDRATYRDTGREGGGEVTWGSEGAPTQDWLTLTSTCTDGACVATGEVLGPDRQRRAGARTLSFQLTNGAWRDTAPARVKSSCTYDDGSVAGQSWTRVTLEFTPVPDGTFTGALTTVVESNECGDQGNTVVTPLTAQRVGDPLV
ncbi:Rv2253/PknI dimerization domain-containing protein [Mycobacterium sp. NPDC003323]